MAMKSGSSPMSPVTTLISVTVMSRLRLRPMRSPRWPNTTAPSGRARKPIANEAKAASVATAGSSVAKYSRSNTIDAAVP